MKKILVLALLLIPIVINAQNQATATNKFAWDQAGPDLVTVSAYTYKYYPDGATTGITFSNVTCTASGTVFTCIVAIPAFTLGNHTVQLTASNAAGESVKSSPLGFSFVVIPAAPANVRVQ